MAYFCVHECGLPDLDAQPLTPGQVLLGYFWPIWGITVQTSYVNVAQDS